MVHMCSMPTCSSWAPSPSTRTWRLSSVASAARCSQVCTLIGTSRMGLRVRQSIHSLCCVCLVHWQLRFSMLAVVPRAHTTCLGEHEDCHNSLHYSSGGPCAKRRYFCALTLTPVYMQYACGCSWTTLAMTSLPELQRGRMQTSYLRIWRCSLLCGIT